MASQAKLPSHKLSLDFLLKEAQEAHGHLNEARKGLKALASGKLSLGLESDLTKVELPFIQNILRRLNVAPKPKEWRLDKSLNKKLVDTLLTEHLIGKFIKQTFLSNIQHFFVLLGLSKEFQGRQALRIKQRAFHAMRYRNENLYDLDHKWNEEELRKLRELHHYQTQLIVAMYAGLSHLEHARDELLAQTRVDFFAAIKTDAFLANCFAGENIESLGQFSDLYVEAAAECQDEIEADQTMLRELKHVPKPARDKQRIQSIKEKLLAHQERLLHLPEYAAKACNLGEECQLNLARQEARECLDLHLSPSITSLRALNLEIKYQRSSIQECEERRTYIERLLPIGALAMRPQDIHPAQVNKKFSLNYKA